MDTSPEAIGERLRKVRTVRGWHQNMLASLLEISPQRWNNYETGRSVPPPPVLAKFWQLTGATTDFILMNRSDGMPMELVMELQKLDHLEAKSA